MTKFRRKHKEKYTGSKDFEFFKEIGRLEDVMSNVIDNLSNIWQINPWLTEDVKWIRKTNQTYLDVFDLRHEIIRWRNEVMHAELILNKELKDKAKELAREIYAVITDYTKEDDIFRKTADRHMINILKY